MAANVVDLDAVRAKAPRDRTQDENDLLAAADDFAAPSRTTQRRVARQGQAADKARLEDKSTKADAPRGRSTKGDGRRRTGSKPRTKVRKARTKARRTATKTRKTAKRATRELVAPSGTLTGLLFGSIALVALYVFLTRADALTGFLGGLQSALEWLSDPTAIIEFD